VLGDRREVFGAPVRVELQNIVCGRTKFQGRQVAERRERRDRQIKDNSCNENQTFHIGTD